MKKTAALAATAALALSLVMPGTGLASGAYPKKGSYNCYTGGNYDFAIKIKGHHKYKINTGGHGKFKTKGHKINFKSGPAKWLKGKFGKYGTKDYALQLHDKKDSSLQVLCLHD